MTEHSLQTMTSLSLIKKVGFRGLPLIRDIALHEGLIGLVVTTVTENCGMIVTLFNECG